MENVPKLLIDVEFPMSVFNPPREIEPFLKHCQRLVGEMKNVMARARVVDHNFLCFTCCELINSVDVCFVDYLMDSILC